MGTDLVIDVRGSDRALLAAAVDAAVAEMRRIEDLMTTWRPSPLRALNAAAGEGPQPVEPELAAIVGRSCAVAELTGGAFDPTFMAVGRLWDFKAEAPVLPDAEALRRALACVGAGRVGVDPDAMTVDLPRGMAIGLGGIAKGYGVDRAMRVLRERGVRHAVVNAGGDMKVLGRDVGEAWEVAIKHPRDRERAIAVLRVSNSCVVTSGDYERFFEIEGKRYHHILDPRTGYPSRGCIAATVVGPSAELADALATAVCVLGPEEGLELVASVDRYDVIAIDMAGRVRATARLRGSLLPVEAAASRATSRPASQPSVGK